MERWQRPARVLLHVAVALVIIGVASLTRDLGPSPSSPVDAQAPSTTTTTAGPAPVVPVSTPLARPRGEIPRFDAPDGTQIGTAGIWYGKPVTMPIVERRDEWLRVMVPERPNESTAWVRRADVDVLSTAHRIVIDLSDMRLRVYERGHEVFSAPVGIGTERTPTAPGRFFVANIEDPGPPGYGPVVLDTSGHSEAIQSWKGSGDAITSIHGTISARSAAQIGTTGARNSNGCIRMHHDDQVKLRVIPLGTPVDIVP